MAEAKMNAVTRSGGTKGYLNELRSQGKIPAVIYGKGIAGQSIELNIKDFESIIRKKGRNALIDLTVEGEDGPTKHVVMVKEIQRDPIRGDIVHADLYKVSLKDKIHAAVPVILKGESVGQKAGGIVQTGIREVEIEAIPTKIPDSISVDITSLDIGEHLTVGDLPAAEDYKILSEPEGILVTIVAPRMAEQPETTEAEGPAVAPAKEEAGPQEEAGEKGEGE